MKGKSELSTRQAIIEHAIRQFARNGFERASFQAIADSCKVSQTAVFYHFPDKESLIRGAIDQVVIHNHEYVSKAMLPTDSARTRLVKHFRQNIAWAFERPEEAQVLLMLYYFGSIVPEFSTIYSTLLDRARARIFEHILAGQREGLFRRESLERSRLRAELFHDALVGGFVNALATQGDRKVLQRFESKWALELSQILI
jgi:AcrR family transcriptional regulator